MQPTINTHLIEETSQRGDFDALMKQSYAKVYRQAQRLLQNASEAEDATQEAFLNAWRSYDKFDGARLPNLDRGAAWDAWLHRIVTNVAYNRLRTQRRKKNQTLSLDMPIETSPEASLLTRIPDDANKQPERVCLDTEFREQMNVLLNALPQEQATALRLHVYDQFSYEEIAQRTGCAVGTVRSRIHRACSKLRAEMRGRRTQQYTWMVTVPLPKGAGLSHSNSARECGQRTRLG